MVARDTRFALGGLLIMAGLIPLEIAISASVPVLNLGLLFNLGTTGLVIEFVGFLLVGNALFQT